jgi:hypothetical protein
MRCHNGGGEAPRWTVAGTLYSTAAGGPAVAGATIEVVDASGKKLLLATGPGGNFWSQSQVSYPLTVRATKCPSDLHMSASVTNGSCNANGCHSAGMRIH